MHMTIGATQGPGVREAEVEGLLQVNGADRHAVRAARNGWVTRLAGQSHLAYLA